MYDILAIFTMTNYNNNKTVTDNYVLSLQTTSLDRDHELLILADK